MLILHLILTLSRKIFGEPKKKKKKKNLRNQKVFFYEFLRNSFIQQMEINMSIYIITVTGKKPYKENNTRAIKT